MSNYTSYATAVKWLNTSLILCNEIPQIDESVWDNMMFPMCNEDGETEEEIYQWILTSASTADVDYLTHTFGLKFTYSDKLDIYVLCVTHWGTGWDEVRCEVLNDEWWEINGETHGYKGL